MQTGTNGPRGRGMKWVNFVSRDQSSRSHETKVRFGSPAEPGGIILDPYVSSSFSSLPME